ncbi:MAG: hypothetical protein ACTSUI_02950 [Promethearchaeota archaeon]
MSKFEYKFFNSYLPFFPTKEAYILPLASSEIEVFLRRLPSVESLDTADISLLCIALREKGVILSDDGGLTAVVMHFKFRLLHCLLFY